MEDNYLNRLKYIVFVAVLVVLFVFGWICKAQADPITWTNDEIVNAIFLAEGGYKAQYLYGIRSVSYKDEAEARKICFQSVINNRKRYAKYGYKNYKTYLEFLASRYCPTTGNLSKAERELNQYWLKNVLYFLKKGANND